MGDITIRRFGSDFGQIDEVKSADRILIEDASDGVVKYAKPGQVNKALGDIAGVLSDAEDTAAALEEKAEAAEKAVDGAVEKAEAAADAANDAANAANTAAEAAVAAVENIGELELFEPITEEEIDELLEDFRFIDASELGGGCSCDMEEITAEEVYELFGTAPSDAAESGEMTADEATEIIEAVFYGE